MMQTDFKESIQSLYPEEYVVLELSPRYQNGDWVIWNQEFPDGAPEDIRKLGEEFSHLKIGIQRRFKVL